MSNREIQKSIALDAYNALAESLAAEVGTKIENACYGRPAMLSLMPDVRHKTVLDVTKEKSGYLLKSTLHKN